MRLRDNVLTGLGVGLAGGFVTGVALDGGMGALISACAGGLLGALTGAYLVVTARWPFWTAAALLGAAPICLLLGALFGLPALVDLPALLALPLAVSLLRDREARERVVSNALTLAVAVYAAVTLLAYLAHPAQATLDGALETLTPALAFVIGMMLGRAPRRCSGGSSARRGSCWRLPSTPRRSSVVAPLPRMACSQTGQRWRIRWR